MRAAGNNVRSVLGVAAREVIQWIEHEPSGWSNGASIYARAGDALGHPGSQGWPHRCEPGARRERRTLRNEAASSAPSSDSDAGRCLKVLACAG